MAIDIFAENVMPLREAAKVLPKKPGNKKISICSLWRWCHSGLKARDGTVVQLESIKFGGTTCTSKEALQRFFDRLAAEEKPAMVPPSVFSRQRRRQIEQAEEELRRAGI